MCTGIVFCVLYIQYLCNVRLYAERAKSLCPTLTLHVCCFSHLVKYIEVKGYQSVWYFQVILCQRSVSVVHDSSSVYFLSLSTL